MLEAKRALAVRLMVKRMQTLEKAQVLEIMLTLQMMFSIGEVANV